MNDTTPRANPLREHIAATYLAVRVGVGAIGVALPWALWLGGNAFEQQGLQPSMSAYYYVGRMRDVFVGVLFAVGLFLYLYKGFGRRENVALNVAGLSAMGVALFPTTPPGIASGSVLTLHGSFAVVLFLCIAYVAIRRASDTLSLVRRPEVAAAYHMAYRILGWGMVISPLVAFGLAWARRSSGQEGAVIFFVEAFAVTMFGAYWLLKSAEMRQTNAERLAVQGGLKFSSQPDTKLKMLGRVVQTAPLEE